VSIDFSARPTVGRDRELQQLDAALEALADDAPGAVAIEGEPGIGKSRLLRELRDRAEARGQLLLCGSAAEFERSMPFSVWADALNAYVAAQDLELPDADDLAEILPALRRPGAAGSAVADDRYRAHRALRGLLARLAQDRPLVLALDDLHWSDQASIDLVAALLRRAPSAPVLLVLAFRPGQAPPALTAALATPVVQRIALEPLCERDAAMLLGADGADAGAQTIFRRAGGNPFYLEQLARVAPHQRPANGDGGAVAGDIPAAVAASLAEELAGLSPAERALLEGAAVAGEPFEPDLAAAVGELSLADGLDALDALLGRDLLRPTTVPRRFRFRHPLVRRAVYDATRGGWRLAAHARAVSALTARGAATSELAHHVERCAAQGDEAAIALLSAAGAATAARAPATAARWFEAALRLLPGADIERQVELRVSLASAQRSFELETCRDTLLSALELLPADAGSRRVELTAWCAAVEHWLGRHGDAHGRLVRAWEELPERDTAAAAALQIELAVDGLYTLELGQAVAMGRGALTIAREIGDRALIAAAASALCLTEAAAGAIAAAREHRAEALAQIDCRAPRWMTTLASFGVRMWRVAKSPALGRA